MRGRSFLDTNIFIYCFDTDDAAKSHAASLLVMNSLASRDGVVSYQVVQEFFNVALRKFARPMTPAEAQRYLVSVFRPMLSVHSSPSLMSEGILIHERYKMSWYDSLIVAAALHAGCETLYSQDLQDNLRIGDLRIVNPFG